MEEKREPEYDKCVEISTGVSIKQMIFCGSIALISLTIAGFIFGSKVLDSFLVILTIGAVIMAIFQYNEEEIWDNTRRFFQKIVDVHGKIEYKGLRDI